MENVEHMYQWKFKVFSAHDVTADPEIFECFHPTLKDAIDDLVEYMHEEFGCYREDMKLFLTKTTHPTQTPGDV